MQTLYTNTYSYICILRVYYDHRFIGTYKDNIIQNTFCLTIKGVSDMSKTYTIIITDKSTGQIEWTETYYDQITTFKNYVQLQNLTFNPEYFDYKVD